MIRAKSGDGMELSLRFVAEGAQRVTGQKRVIESLKRRGEPSAQAEAELERLEVMLRRLRNHLEIMGELSRSRY